MSTDQNAVLAALHERRSIRKYTGEFMTPDDMRTILDAGRWAPSGRNNQPCVFLPLFRGDERKDALAGHTKYSVIVEKCAAVVCVFLDRARTYHEMKDHQGAGACIQNMLLAAHALGYGCVWLGEIVNQEAGVLAELGLDAQKYEFMAAIAMGRPAAPGASSRRDLTEFLLEPLPGNPGQDED